MKKYFSSIILILIGLIIGYWWYYTFTYVNVMQIQYEVNGIETTYDIVPKYTKLIIKNNTDSAYIFYNKKGKSVVIIEMKDIKKIKFIDK